jgi:thiosulfate reductase cytochrome b subunit
MIWSGLLIYWASDVYRIGAFHFWPDWVYRALHLDHRLARGMSVHFFFMWIFAINGLAYILYIFLSGKWRELFPNRNSLRDAIHVTLHDFGLRRDLPPQGKYNGAQRIAYTAVLAMGCGSVATGLAIYKPTQVAWLTALAGGYEMARFLHFWLTIGYLGFFAIHVAQVVRAGWNNFRSMVAGFEVLETKGAVKAD